MEFIYDKFYILGEKGRVDSFLGIDGTIVTNLLIAMNFDTYQEAEYQLSIYISEEESSSDSYNKFYNYEVKYVETSIRS